MAKQTTVQISVSNTVDNITNNITSNLTTPTTSSNLAVVSFPVTASGWTQLPLGGATDILNVFIWNDNVVNTGSVVTIATGSNGQNPLSTLRPGAGSSIAWSGSLTLYAKVTSTNPFVDGVLQFSAQQS
jgi:hypothetical protein